MPSVITVGELLVEIMRTDVDVGFDEMGTFAGPFPSGAPANFVDCVARLGVSAGIVGAVGNDAFGRFVVDRLARDGVDTSQIRTRDDDTTGVAFVSYASDGSREFIFHLANAAAGTVGPAAVDSSSVVDADVVHVAGSSLLATESMREACYEVVDLANANGTLVSFDPNVRPELLGDGAERDLLLPILERADVVTPTEEELSFLANVEPDSDSGDAVESLLDAGISTVAVTQGAAGCTIYTADDIVAQPGFDVEVVDPTGAGDAFAAAVVVGHIEGQSLEALATFANATGALAVTERGPMEGLADRPQVDALVDTVR